MNFVPRNATVPFYKGHEWTAGRLPRDSFPWVESDQLASFFHGQPDESATECDLASYAAAKPWIWPSRTHYFFSDLHADADALLLSLVASGGVTKTGPGDFDFKLNNRGIDATFVFGGDFFDKGPHNLRLMRTLKHLIDLRADVVLLVGNHDLRTFIGLSCAGRKDTRHAHLFVRMGKKTVPLFREIFDEYLAESYVAEEAPDEDAVRAKLFPDAGWYEQFPDQAAGILPSRRIEKEVRRIAEKCQDFAAQCQALGLTLGMINAALEKAKELFLEPGGEFSWLFERLDLAHRAGSLLMVHAGLDNQAALLLKNLGVDGLNRTFRAALKEDLFDLYNGPLGNVFRTKYRANDFPFTNQGLADTHRAGIYAIVHGHRNLLNGQRITIRQGMLNFECDASVDCNTRIAEGLEGPGGGVTIIAPEGTVTGLSTDAPFAKTFDITRYGRMATFV
ncbi:MAG TPA: metallophosphoesterase [Rhodospirillales bacterium]|nr:metallophosphoesterase [Rhodospirillales bacterium]